MRVLLAAMEPGADGIEGKLARHRAVLARARSQGCTLAVFPEASLTGAVDPTQAPQQAVPVSAAPVRELVAATRQTGVGAIFGVAERADDGYYLTQLYAYGGQLLGTYRKRWLGEGEEAYRTGVADGVFPLGAAGFGLVICAEGAVEAAWQAAARAGAQVVFFCSAPGLYGRRTDEQSWRRGHAWWEERGLGDAIRYARRHRLWVAVATMAGSSGQEDFPGLAALVDPTGEVVARLPDWRPGELVVEIPVPVEVEPVRLAARALVVDEAGAAVLVQFADQLAGTSWWCPPGGGLDPGEDHPAAVRRELREELGLDAPVLGPWLGHRTHTFVYGGRWGTQRERWLLCRTARFPLDPARLPALRAENVHEVRWWTARQLRAARVVTVPANLADLLDRVNAGALPDPGTDLGP